MDKNKLFRYILSYIKKYIPFVILSLVLSVISVICMLNIPLTIGEIIDSLIYTKQFDISVYILKILLAISIYVCFTYLQGIINNFITYNITKDIRKDLFKKVIRLPLSYIDTHQSGDIVSKVVSDVDIFALGLLLGFTEAFTSLSTIVLTFIFLIKIHIVLAIVLLILTPISIFVAKFISSRIHKYFNKQNQMRSIQTSFTNEMLSNLKIVKAYNHEEENKIKFKEINDEYTEANLNAVFYSSIVNPSTRFVNAFIYAIICLTGSILIITKGTITVGLLSSALKFSKDFMKPFNDISSVLTELQNALVCARRAFGLLELEEEKDTGTKVLENVSGDIKLSHVFFSYNKETRLIENLNLHVKKGMKVAIVGPTGAGKTTLINLLMRFYDVTSGEIHIDDNSINELTKKTVRENFGMVLQDTWLKSSTIYDNITMGKKDASIEDVKKACYDSFASNFIEKMEDGYFSMINENGDNLSQGEKQLLCIARVMLIMPPMLILDEATSSIDTRTEIKIQKAFYKLMKDKTTFIVAHRLSTIIDADLILVLKDGKIIEQGNHQTLIKNKGFYYELYNSQFN